ncbi:MAG TPA: FtsX-like permease family protein [Candidatus Marinimicrobia bacterium]|jgi:lipoprotein-releasing system permease protein|nr:ABC transporter permease [Candidatus Neomarinimicrobiota bacterium]MDP7483890.1 ABC transporter permease [Candidatus Neomarinimicrobiota bacterium]HJL84282.1 FtsX-like permease family protein [Candidatus Neomarinimicrobiota bacterium]HJM10473.1 FtsX-like permease family protein [Candidatus Neomarinimicrobiota bacterium]|tara:strand:- start:5630 stop:6835 length:1206 start_codon:yes stop_codon:yes gene_type:complete
MMKLESWLARRMLLSRKKVGLISWSGIISILGVAVGCFALIISVAVLNGFEREVRNKVVGFESDLRLTLGETKLNMDNLGSAFDQESDIAGYSAFIERKAVAIAMDERSLVKVKAVEEGSLQKIYKIDGVGEMEVIGNKAPVYVGKGIADRLGLQSGDRLRLMNPLDNQIYLGMPTVLDGRVAGVFETRILDFDQTYVFVPLDVGQALFKSMDTFDGIDFRLTSSARKDTMKALILSKAPAGAVVSGWEDMHQTLFQAMQMEKLGSMVVLSLIVIVACFNIASTLTMLVLEKIREVGILKTIGFSQVRIGNIFRLQGIFIGGFGLLLGGGLGLLFVLGQERLGLIRLPETIYFVQSLPVAISLTDVITIFLICVIVIALAVYFPSREARRLLPTEAIQYEK